VGGFENTVTFGPGTPTLTSEATESVFVSKWSPAGDLTWAQSVASGPGDVTPRGFTVDGAGNLLMGVSFEGMADFDPGMGSATLTSVGGSDGAIVQFNPDGSLAWLRHVAGPGPTWAEGVASDSAGNVYVTGFYESSVTLPTGHVITNSGTGLTYQPGNGSFFMRLALGDPGTKFYVVDDGTANQTFEYQAGGTAGSASGLNSGNAAPRGAASTAVGDRVWVIDANRKVFVYDINGNLQGSWTAGTLPSNATPEGIATNGVDVWIVDGKSDKTYRYANAASRLSGSQNAASSFSLNSANSNPKDIVTDGASLWVVNDASADKVFKYTISGSLLGSWTINGAGAAPTGITIDPANVGDVWIVDSGTDRVYRFASAASRVSGSHAAADGFSLSSGNGNPQGIADPPPAAPNAPTAQPRQREQLLLPATDSPSTTSVGLSKLRRQSAQTITDRLFSTSWAPPAANFERLTTQRTGENDATQELETFVGTLDAMFERLEMTADRWNRA
jgi:hypothetical protein